MTMPVQPNKKITKPSSSQMAIGKQMMKKSPSPELILSRSATVSPTLEWDNPAVEDTDHDHDVMVSSPCLAEEIETATVAMDDIRDADDKVALCSLA